MFNNIGGKIKTYAEAVCWVGIVASIITGIVIMIKMESIESIFIGLLICLIGPFSSWVGSFTLYALGQLVENSDILVKTLAPNYKADISDTEKLNEASNAEIANVTKAYSKSSWSDDIKALSDEELLKRYNSEDWQYEYRALCKKELENRNCQN